MSNNEMGEISEVHNKATRLFTYLEKALAVDDTVIRDFRFSLLDDKSAWWVADYPADLDNLYIKRSLVEGQADEVIDDDLVLRVQKTNLEAAPALPVELEEWVPDVNPAQKPEALKKIDRKTKFSADASRVDDLKLFLAEYNADLTIPPSLEGWLTFPLEGKPERIKERYLPDPYENHPELAGLLEAYTVNEWQDWAARTQKAYAANQLYDKLYALRLTLKNQGDAFELLYGQGVLTWKHPSGQDIYSPLFLTPLSLDFNAITRTIQITQDSMVRSYVELTSLQDLSHPAEMDIVSWADKINADPFDFWHHESLVTQSKFITHTLANNSQDAFSSEIEGAPNIQGAPAVWNAPVIFVRKRSNDMWSKYAALIRRDIETNHSTPTDFISDLVGDYGAVSTARNEESQESHETLEEGELLFPLPWNEEQKRIADRIESNYGVVVKGPPGTGKSHTIANLIARFLAQGKTVLVTSQTSKALDVLRDKLPENIQSLAIAQLQQSSKQDQVLQDSIAEISSNLGERHTKFSEEKSNRVRKDLQTIREERARLTNQIQQQIQIDSKESLIVDDKTYTPMEAARVVAEHEGKKFGWFTDNLDFKQELTFTGEDIHRLYELATLVNKDDDSLRSKTLPVPSDLPDRTELLNTFTAHEQAQRLGERAADGISADFRASHEEVAAIIERIDAATALIDGIAEVYQQDLFDRCIISDAEQDKWLQILKRIYLSLRVIQESEARLLGHTVVGVSELTVESRLQTLETLRQRMASGGKIAGMAKMLLPADIKNMLSVYIVDGQPIDELRDLDVLESLFKKEAAYNEVRTLLSQSMATLKSAPTEIAVEDSLQIEVLLKALTRIVRYSDEFKDIDAFMKRAKSLAGLSYKKREDLQQFRGLLESFSATYQLAALNDILRSWIDGIAQTADTAPHPIYARFAEAIQVKSLRAWDESVEELEKLTIKKQNLVAFHEIASRIYPVAPLLYAKVIADARANVELFDVSELAPAWTVARLDNWLDAIHGGVNIDTLQKELERLTKKEFDLNSELVTLIAWQRQIDRVTKPQRDALMAWSHAMEKLGKGTGKYAHRQLRAAQEALREAKDAVPVWIMPLSRVAQMFPEPKAGMFDVVIFDEASQCDIKGINIAYLGKKMLVVGDPDQISPAGVFQNQEKIYELISRFLSDIPHKESFLTTSSLFALAKIRLSNIVQLNEHFRCVPDIISFSNRNVYEGKLQPLRYPNPKGLLAPALVPVFIESGYQNKNNQVNEPEAQAIIAKLVELIAHPEYQRRPNGKICTFGVISLLGTDQAKRVSELIRDTFDEQTIEERQLICGDAYAFQGDERDVILLSMVRALSPDKPDERIMPLTKRDAMQRFNVAASRARDQMFLFHSLPLSMLHNEDDWRLKLLNAFYNPIEEDLKAGRDALKQEFNSGHASQFSVDVGNVLIDRGYRVIPEYPVIGYRIDLVVQGENARLAIECDGDQYHTLENFDNDQIRERQLRRAGWEFWRVTGSSYYRNKENALTSLWEKLDEMGIKPIKKGSELELAERNTL